MKALYKIALLAVAASSLTACFNKSEPNYQYMPNMYEPVGYETYAESAAFANGKEGQLPAKGSIPRGFTPYEYENSTEGYELAKANLKSPLAPEDIDLERAKAAFHYLLCNLPW